MKRTICRLLAVCVLGALLSSCYPVPTINRPRSIVGLDQTLRQVASGDMSKQSRLARDFFCGTVLTAWVKIVKPHGGFITQRLIAAISMLKNNWQGHRKKTRLMLPQTR
jgi:hypothetical protein